MPHLRVISISHDRLTVCVFAALLLVQAQSPLLDGGEAVPSWCRAHDAGHSGTAATQVTYGKEQWWGLSWGWLSGQVLQVQAWYSTLNWLIVIAMDRVIMTITFSCYNAHVLTGIITVSIINVAATMCVCCKKCIVFKYLWFMLCWEYFFGKWHISFYVYYQLLSSGFISSS